MDKKIYEDMKPGYEPQENLDELERELSKLGLEHNDEYDDMMTKRINSSIRKSFLKAGIITGIAAIVLTLVIVFGLPKIVDQFYYDPATIVSENSETGEVCQLQKDINVYAEAELPELGPDIKASVDSRGYGNYSFYLMSGFDTKSNEKSYNSSYAGSINKDEGVWYDPDVLSPPSRNNQENFVETAATSKNEISSLGDNEEYYAYITFKNDKSYDEMLSWFNMNESKYNLDNSFVWCAVESYSKDRLNYGFRMYDGEDGDKCIATAGKAEKHFLSLMDYLAGDEEFLGTVGDSTSTYRRSASYVRKNGLNIYGIMIVSDKSHIEKIASDASVQNVTTSEML